MTGCSSGSSCSADGVGVFTHLKSIAEIAALPPETSFKSSDSRVPMLALGIEFPLGIALCYLGLHFFAVNYMAGKKKGLFSEGEQLKHVHCAWNAILALFNFVGWFCVAPRFQEVLFEGLSGKDGVSLKDFLCDPPERFLNIVDGQFGYWTYLFVLMKIFETANTFFLVFQKSKVRFLQYYYHAAVIFISWHGWVTVSFTGVFFAPLNYFMSGVIYTYTTLLCFQSLKPQLDAMAPVLTSMHIAQLAAGCYISFTAFKAVGGWDGDVPDLISQPKATGCVGLPDRLNVVAGYFFFGSNLVLFLTYLWNRFMNSDDENRVSVASLTQKERPDPGHVEAIPLALDPFSSGDSMSTAAGAPVSGSLPAPATTAPTRASSSRKSSSKKTGSSSLLTKKSTSTVVAQKPATPSRKSSSTRVSKNTSTTSPAKKPSSTTRASSTRGRSSSKKK